MQHQYKKKEDKDNSKESVEPTDMHAIFHNIRNLSELTNIKCIILLRNTIREIRNLHALSRRNSDISKFIITQPNLHRLIEIQHVNCPLNQYHSISPLFLEHTFVIPSPLTQIRRVRIRIDIAWTILPQQSYHNQSANPNPPINPSACSFLNIPSIELLPGPPFIHIESGAFAGSLRASKNQKKVLIS
jgi:hypothetical protein